MASILLDYIAPIGGVIVSNAIVFSSYPAITRVIRSGHLGELNR